MAVSVRQDDAGKSMSDDTRALAVAEPGTPGRARPGSAAGHLGPIACINCGLRVVWARVDGFWRLRDEDGEKHRCAA